MKKVGIMTMSRIINYGSFLQAFGLKTLIEEMGYSTEFIDYIYEGNVIPKKSFIDNLIHKIKVNKNFYSFLMKRKNIKKLQNILCDELKKIGVDEPNYSKDIDNLVIGSDEVFNCMQDYPVGYSRTLFGKGYENVNVLSYAASFGYTTYDSLKHYNIDTEISDLLCKFKSISVRDENSYNIIKKITNIDSFVHLDPVLVSDFSKYIPKDKIDKDYIIIYAYPNRLLQTEKKFIKKFAKKYNKKIISLGFYQDIADENIVVDPFTLLAYFRDADYIITDTFHGTVFSVKMNSQFCTIIRESNKNKLCSLLEKLALSDRIVKNNDMIDELYCSKINFSKSNKILDKEIKRTKEYLKVNLK